jgi:glucans biosynthesis protein
MVLLSAGTAAARPQSSRAGVTLDYVANLALERARQPFRSPRLDLPAVLQPDRLGYDDYRKIGFRHDRALWMADKLRFRAEFFHPGYLYPEPVRMHEFVGSHQQPIRFVEDFFDYGDLDLRGKVPATTGYAGFRLAYPLRPGEYPEIGAFLGASYFRLLGADQSYGLSARALALDCGEPDRPEEFPLFTDWWLGKPRPEDEHLVLYAIVDSISAAGAYSFTVRPGRDTIVDVEAVLFFREAEQARAANSKWQPLRTVGLAPLTSMFWYGENSERRFDDYRPEVHDSDGLSWCTSNGDWHWRPLLNPTALRHQRFPANGLRGFGLMQRDRDFASYQELSNTYHRVPSVWVEPRGDWPGGNLHLVELPTTSETADNIVAFWEPAETVGPLEPLRLGYRLYWTAEGNGPISRDRVVATRIGRDARQATWREIVVDFRGPRLDRLDPGRPPTAVTACSGNATIAECQVFRNGPAGGWRVVLKMEPRPDNKAPVDLRCALHDGADRISETWIYQWSPP